MHEELSTEKIEQKMLEFENWGVDDADEIIRKEFTFPDFKEALAFVNKVGEIAEAKQHHPDIMLSYGKVQISLTTHDADGLTEKDFDLAKEIDKINS